MVEKYCLGIESTADDFGVGISSFNGEILANVNYTYVPSEGGIHPREAARHHSRIAAKALSEAVKRAGLSIHKIAVVSFSQGPGLGPCLRTGATAARALATLLDVPLVGVNHCIAHIEIGKHISGFKNPVILYVSGGNTIVSTFKGGRYQILGETLDIAVGNCLDILARKAGLIREKGKPWGLMVEEKAKEGSSYVSLPYTVKGMDISLSGILTSVQNLLYNRDYSVEDVLFSFQESVFSMLTEITERALVHTEKCEVLLTGGVAANRRLQRMLIDMSKDHEAKFYAVPNEYSSDNGVMIAWNGVLNYKHGLILPIDKSYVKLKWRLENVEIPWVQENVNKQGC